MDCWGSGWLVPVPLYCQNFKLDRHLRCLFICLLFYTLILLLLPCLSLVCFFCYVLYTWYTHLMRYWWISDIYTRDWLILGSLRPTLSIVLKIRTLSLIVFIGLCAILAVHSVSTPCCSCWISPNWRIWDRKQWLSQMIYYIRVTGLTSCCHKSILQVGGLHGSVNA
jgi:hypothetical protein